MDANLEVAEQPCSDCGKTVAADTPPPELATDPHWAETFPQQDDRYMVCWTCGKVLWVA